jgi:hypothetical protein
MTAVTAEAGSSALDALRAGDCTPACLLSEEGGRCHCRCEGTYHGAALAALTRRQADAS